MSINILKAYIEECKIKGIEPNWKGLNEFKNNEKKRG
ncbi:hypothetical protein J2S18_001996 [Eubacterium multiforme]|uniref:Uncharacterized protein n=1 Tax=Eubacterium multiforme TaxID=83339 RepID=A0ABT9UUR1_9FIRM|nr:hypothetical protein [Eubacterium multiforme]